jgi:class 3 adenylate cyclase/tetratricopeptide (TPR) repeat protein
VICPSCGTENADNAKFCVECGTSLALVCPSCGTPHAVGQRFCAECGTALSADAPAETVPREAPAAERRLVTVLFADLVGFTAASEQRDAEETRELLSSYFDTSRRLIELYGGTVEKFIGDAVMAVWGTPTATEDDAERAVRAALDLVAAVPELDPALQARAGVLTGEAAVTIGAEGEGMVAGDLVNTASRVQSAADPGTVLVGETTRRASEQAIVYEAAGAQELKGKAEAVEVYRALRVVSGRGGELKSIGLEAPFVGRDRELKLIKELFHASAQDRRAHLVSVTGIGGIGKSRLTWEFYKYFDGIVELVWWHRGRCLAYGEGVAYWALADMVRMRCRIGEEEDAETARRKLRATLEEHLLDAREREFVEPRLAHLLGLEEGLEADRQDLFAAWRLFLERLADQGPLVLAFEDMQWADTSLLDFVEYLLEWSRDYPLFVITLARPELQERRASGGAGQRNFTSLFLEPLSDEAMRGLLEGLVPGLPDRLRDQILDRAEGVPLYAVETVRMLLDRGLLALDESSYRLTGEIERLEVPETLHALIAARLDGLSPYERRLLQDGAVLGKTFTRAAVAAVSGLSDGELEPLLTALVRKEVLGVQADLRSPEHGQYGFLQELVRHVAYEMLSKRERKTRHLKAADHLEHALELDEIAEVLAAHYLAAVEAAPEANDVTEIRDRARSMLTRAGERAASLAAPDEGQRYFERAAELADASADEAALLVQAGKLAAPAGRVAEGRVQLERAIALYEQAGDRSSAALASVGLGDIDVWEGKLDEAARRFESALPALEARGASAELAATLAQLGRVHALQGSGQRALAILDRALVLAERLRLDEVFVQALTSRAICLIYEGRHVEARVLNEGVLRLAREAELHDAWLRAAGNLGVVLEDSDRYADALELMREVEARAVQLGDRENVVYSRSAVATLLVVVGRWSEALALAEQVRGAEASPWATVETVSIIRVRCERGELAEAESLLREFEWVRDGEQPELIAAFMSSEARLLRAQGKPAEALAAAELALTHREELAITSTKIKANLVEAMEATFELGDLDRVEELLGSIETLSPGELTASLEAQATRFRARLDAARGQNEGVDGSFRRAEAIFSEFGIAFYLGVAELEHAEWLISQGRSDEAEPLLAEAREIFERLEAKPWLERAAQVDANARVPA